MRRRRRIGCLLFIGIVLGAGGGAYLWLMRGIAPTSPGPVQLVRFEARTNLSAIAPELRRRGLIRDERAFGAYVWLKRLPRQLGSGTYRLTPGQTPEQLVRALSNPIRQMVRLPETNWAARNANLLERAQVTTAEDYMRWFRQPSAFVGSTSVPLPASGTLEGYLFPDTYDLPPLLGARAVIERQLRAFEQKVMPEIDDPAKLRRTLIVASLIELEVALDRERPLVAGVIENRLRIGMPLQIDAAINYGLQKWRPLTYADLRRDGLYNTYTRKGLPPGPICSPSLASIRAALKPAKHEYLYYVAMPGKYHLFAKTFEEHRRNIARRKAALAAISP